MLYNNRLDRKIARKRIAVLISKLGVPTMLTIHDTELLCQYLRVLDEAIAKECGSEAVRISAKK